MTCFDLHSHVRETYGKICQTLTSDDKSSFGGAESRFSGETVLGAALVRFVAIFWSDVPDVEFTGWKYQVLAICCVSEGVH